MARSDKEYIRSLATVVNELFLQDIYDPTVEQIARARFDDAIPQTIVNDVQMRLARVRKALEEDGHQTCPLSETYYRRFRIKPPKTRDEARLCLTIGRSKTQVGLLLLSGQPGTETDIIWQEWVSIQMNQAAGKVKHSADHLFEAVVNDRVSNEKAGLIVGEYTRRAQPARPEIAQRVTEAITDGN